VRDRQTQRLDADRVRQIDQLATLLRQLRRRDARRHGDAELTYRQLATKTGWSRTVIGQYFTGQVLPPTVRFDVLIRLLGASPAEQGALASARDRVEEQRRNAAPAGQPETGERSPAVPRQLPPMVRHFAGRSDELRALDALLDEATGSDGTVVISVIAGTPGAGKTALAVHWAHLVADRFPDGQLFVNLCGYDVNQVVQPDAALAAFLRALGVEAGDIAHDLAERAAQFRTLMHGRRMLVVLDNAYAEEQVRPLLPGSGSCFVVVTSRDRMTGLTTRDGARRIGLDVLTPVESIGLLRDLVGDRVAVEPAATVTLVEQCDRLPLVLRVAAELVALRPTMPLAELVRELANEHHRLDRFDAVDDERSAVRTVFSWSYRRLPAAAARVFRLLGLHPGADLDGYAVAALAGTDLSTARRGLDRLVRTHLVQEPVSGRYRMHDLLRVYAAECAGQESEPDRRAALTRLLRHYLGTAAAAMDIVYPAEGHRRPRIAAPAGATPALTTEQQARNWLDAERTNLVAATALAAEHGWPAQAGLVAATVEQHLNTGGHYSDALTLHDHALRAARALADPHAEANARFGLAGTCMQLGRFEQAAEYFRQALAGFRNTGDPAGVARAMSRLGWACAELGDYAQALDHYRQALAGHRDIGDRHGEAKMLCWVGLELGRLTQYDDAIDHLHRALVAFQEFGDPFHEIEVLSDLGQVLIWARRYGEALEPTQQALKMCRQIDDRLHEADLLNNLAESQAATGLPDEALTHYRSVITVAGAAGQRIIQARAHTGTADVLRATGRPEQARRHWQAALAIYTALDTPQAAEVRAKLAALDAEQPDRS
jgi:tetratricopeptide (TPR) repeat protein